VHDGALPGEPGRVRVLVHAPHERQAVAVLLSGVPEDPLMGTPWPAGKPDYPGGQVPGVPPSPGRTSPVSYP